MCVCSGIILCFCLLMYELVFFFFKQKTAYEFRLSLVGSEMCIRDRDTLPEKEKHYFDTIADSAHQMGKLIDDLLRFSRTGRQEMQLISLDMNTVLKDALQVIQHESFGRGIKWVVAGLPRVTGDYALLL